MKHLIIILTFILTTMVLGKDVSPFSIYNEKGNLFLNGLVEGTVQLSYYDIRGRVLLKKREVIHKGINSLFPPTNVTKNQLIICEIYDGKNRYNFQISFK